ncbi:UNVERIFIED_CONTAM: hypothetical protein Slati_4232600 [Sesamum latifolium]|uniref:Uncharacterized protein n=1 Tax=Sesamum latifolium TaxID=2727402 RepID=A0AAW2TBZ1_9LAMI
MWKQQGKAQWLQEGDRNTPYFHTRASARKKKNSLSHLRNEASNPTDEVMDEVLRGMPTRVSESMNDALVRIGDLEANGIGLFVILSCKQLDLL